jgi:hypothetical protein
MTTTRREFLGTVAAAVTVAVWPRRAAAAPVTMTVYKSASCGCCSKWVAHIKGAGFAVTVKDTEDVEAVKRDMGVPAAVQSCHTALVGGYIVEGHVPADVVRRLLAEKPKGLGLAVPGMPVGAPGMEGAPKERYDVLLFERSGATKVFVSR